MTCRSKAGFTLLELLVVLGIASFLLMMAAPAVSSGVANARARHVVQRFMGDFAWLRAQAATGRAPVTLTLAEDCSWAASVGGEPDTAHSLTGAQWSAQAPGASCSTGGSAVVFAFTAQGFVTPSLAMSFSSAGGQRWPLQVMTSGSILRAGAAS